jgi:quinol monooxygenase YgiN
VAAAAMIHVLAFVSLKPQMMAPALDCYRALVPQVLAHEPGCLEYTPTTDCDLSLPNQRLDPDTIVVTERWRSIEDFRAHLVAPHSIEFRAAIKDYLENIVVKVTKPAI